MNVLLSEAVNDLSWIHWVATAAAGALGAFFGFAIKWRGENRLDKVQLLKDREEDRKSRDAQRESDRNDFDSITEVLQDQIVSLKEDIQVLHRENYRLRKQIELVRKERDAELLVVKDHHRNCEERVSQLERKIKDLEK
jgi:hypothetical protein